MIDNHLKQMLSHSSNTGKNSKYFYTLCKSAGADIDFPVLLCPMPGYLPGFIQSSNVKSNCISQFPIAGHDAQ